MILEFIEEQNEKTKMVDSALERIGRSTLISDLLTLVENTI